MLLLSYLVPDRDRYATATAEADVGQFRQNIGTNKNTSSNKHKNSRSKLRTHRNTSHHENSLQFKKDSDHCFGNLTSLYPPSQRKPHDGNAISHQRCKLRPCSLKLISNDGVFFTHRLAHLSRYHHLRSTQRLVRFKITTMENDVAVLTPSTPIHPLPRPLPPPSHHLTT